MRELALLMTSFAGGLISGLLAAILAFFVVQLVREGLESPKQFAVAALVLLSIFGTALFYVAIVILSNWPLFIGATISFLWAAKPLFKETE